MIRRSAGDLAERFGALAGEIEQSGYPLIYENFWSQLHLVVDVISI